MLPSSRSEVMAGEDQLREPREKPRASSHPIGVSSPVFGKGRPPTNLYHNLHRVKPVQSWNPTKASTATNGESSAPSPGKLHSNPSSSSKPSLQTISSNLLSTPLPPCYKKFCGMRYRLYFTGKKFRTGICTLINTQITKIQTPGFISSSHTLAQGPYTVYTAIKGPLSTHRT